MTDDRDPIHTPGRYIRSQLEAELIASQLSHVVAGMRGSSSNDRDATDRFRLASRITIEVIRRGYRIAWKDAVRMATEWFQLYKAPCDLAELRELVDCLDPSNPLRVSIALEPEEGRAAESEQWDHFAKILDGDETESIEVSARQLRYWGMRNRPMREQLERGEAIDVSGCDRVGIGSELYYVIPADVWQDDIDLCNAVDERWIWSVGRVLPPPEPPATFVGSDFDDVVGKAVELTNYRTATGDRPVGTILASHGTEFYENPYFECLFLR